MKIAMFTNTYRPHVGGVACSVQTYEDELRSRGCDVQVVAPVFDDAEESDEHVLRVPAVQHFNGSDFSVRLAQPGLVTHRMDAFQPDVVHSHHPFLLGDAALRVAYERGLPLVFTHHTMYENYTHYVPLDSEPMKRVAIQMATEYCNLCHHVIAPSESIKRLLRDRGVTVPISAIPTGIDLDFFASGDGRSLRREFGIENDALVIGHVGRLAEEKNLAFLTEAVARFLSDHPDAVFLVVGDGPAQSVMQQLLLDAGVDQRSVFAGRRSGRDLVDAYAAMDVFAFASRTETQGMVIAEALAAVTPVVALDGPGVREVVTAENGRLLPADANTADFAAALADLTQDRRQLPGLRERAQQSARPFGLTSCADRLTRLYADAVAQSERRLAPDFGPWDALQGRLEAEWKLIAEKAAALSAAVRPTDATTAELS